jgi:hypothetical protein
LCNRSPERLELDVVREPPPAVDLDDRQPLSIGRLEHGIARDVDLPQLEPELRLEFPHLPERAFAEMTSLGVVEDDLGLRDRCPA